MQRWHYPKYTRFFQLGQPEEIHSQESDLPYPGVSVWRTGRVGIHLGMLEDGDYGGSAPMQTSVTIGEELCALGDFMGGAPFDQLYGPRDSAAFYKDIFSRGFGEDTRHCSELEAVYFRLMRYACEGSLQGTQSDDAIWSLFIWLVRSERKLYDLIRERYKSWFLRVMEPFETPGDPDAAPTFHVTVPVWVNASEGQNKLQVVMNNPPQVNLWCSGGSNGSYQLRSHDEVVAVTALDPNAGVVQLAPSEDEEE